jgi:hypothetical protein
MSGLNEANTCRVYITPALKTTGWCDPLSRIAGLRVGRGALQSGLADKS